MDAGTLAIALVAGGVAAFNPCGFALLPAYLGMLVVEPDQDAGGPARATRVPTGRAVRRAVRFAAGMTVGFVVVFGVFAAVVTPFAVRAERYLPVVTVVMGAALLGLGAWLVAGRQLAVPGLAGRGSAPTRTWRSQVTYGASFALASLSCTLAPFLAVTSGALRGGSVAGVAASFLTYAAGMGAVVLVLALAVVTTSSALVTRMRAAGAYVTRASGGLLLVAGAYVAWYGWYEIRVLSGRGTTDPVVSAAASVQGAITRGVVGLGAAPIAVAAAAGLAAAVWLARRPAVDSEAPSGKRRVLRDAED